jgi:hypothetical protein
MEVYPNPIEEILQVLIAGHIRLNPAFTSVGSIRLDVDVFHPVSQNVVGAVRRIRLNGYLTLGSIAPSVLESKRAERILTKILDPVVWRINRTIHTEDVQPATAFVDQACVGLETRTKEKSSRCMSGHYETTDHQHLHQPLNQSIVHSLKSFLSAESARAHGETNHVAFLVFDGYDSV